MTNDKKDETETYPSTEKNKKDTTTTTTSTSQPLTKKTTTIKPKRYKKELPPVKYLLQYGNPEKDPNAKPDTFLPMRIA